MTTSSCDKVQELLAENGANELPAAEAAHLRSCVDCTGFAHGLEAVDSALHSLARIEPSDSTVEKLLAAVRSETAREGTNGEAHVYTNGAEPQSAASRRGGKKKLHAAEVNWQRRFRRMSGWVALAAVLLLTLNVALERGGPLNQVAREMKAAVAPSGSFSSSELNDDRVQLDPQGLYYRPQAAKEEDMQSPDAVIARHEATTEDAIVENSAPVPQRAQEQNRQNTTRLPSAQPVPRGGVGFGAAAGPHRNAPAAPPPPPADANAEFLEEEARIPAQNAAASGGAGSELQANKNRRYAAKPHGSLPVPAPVTTTLAPVPKSEADLVSDAIENSDAFDRDEPETEEVSRSKKKLDAVDSYLRAETRRRAADDEAGEGAELADNESVSPAETKLEDFKRKPAAEPEPPAERAATAGKAANGIAEFGRLDGAAAAPDPGPVGDKRSTRNVAGLIGRDESGKRDGASLLTQSESPLAKDQLKEMKPSDFPAVVEGMESDSSSLNRLSDTGNAKKQSAKEKQASDIELLSGVNAPTVGATNPTALRLPDSLVADEMLSKMKRLDGLTFKEAAGYWSNTYIPGDRRIRQLHSYLSGLSIAELSGLTGITPDFGGAIKQIAQPFDQPAGGALGVYLHADEATVEGETRMLVQVGLQGLDRARGQRPPMNLALVIDYRDGQVRNQTALLRELLLSLARAQDVGDRFRVYFAGCEDGIDIADPQQFKYGSVVVALQNLERCNGENGAGRSIDTALESAVAEVSAGDDQSLPLGSSAVVLVTSHLDGSDSQTLAAESHRSATNGVPVSAIVLGGSGSVKEIDEVVSAGQGSRRTVLRAEEADTVLRQELSAVSEVVARAVRLRIRLAPGVKLVDVLGSERLDTKRAQQVREAEQAIDRRVAKSMGIAADRGDDEEGIQIVIPAFYQGDSHVVLLDVVVPGAGPVADVTARYKDLVHLKNNVSRANLSVGTGSSVRGQLELNVLKNYLASHLANRFLAAGISLRSGNKALARTELEQLRTLVNGFLTGGHGLQGDSDLAKDLHAIDSLLASLDRTGATAGAVSYLGTVAQFAAYQKTMTNPGRK